MQTAHPRDVAQTMRRLATDPMAGPVAQQALSRLERLFARRGRPGITMAASWLRVAMPEAQIETIAVSFMADLLRETTASPPE